MWRRILSLWYTKEPVLNQRIDDDITIIESVSLDRRVTKYKVWDTTARILSDLEARIILNTRLEAPWLWIGADCAFGRIDMTSSFERYLVYGNKITSTFLKNRYPLYHNWRYLDPVTFKEVDFSDTGITIDDPRVERHT